jgi:hypothetical protein
MFPLVFGIGVYCALTFVNPFSTKHILFNLEPYPDALFYVNSAMQFASTGSLDVSYHGYTMNPRITPIYTLVLAAGYFFLHGAQLFYVTNVVLGIGSLCCLFFCLRALTKKTSLIWLGMFLYLIHGYIFWLPSLPMAENAVLFFFLATLAAALQFMKSRPWIVAIGIGVLFLTKYTLIGPVIIFGLFLIWKLWQKKQWQRLLLSGAILLLSVGAYLFSQYHIHFNPLSQFTPTNFNQPSSVSGLVFYSVQFFVPNGVAYLKILFGFREHFLWMTFPFTTFGICVFFVIGEIVLFWKKRNEMSAFFLLLFFSQFPILLIFYVVDARYSILSIPLIALGVAHVLEHLSLKKSQKKLLCVLLGLAIFWQLFSQVGFAKYLIATNTLGRSVAWQYEAVQVANHFFSGGPSVNEKPILITALPPLFVDAYSNQNYTLLPLSPTQEFANKKQYLWGSDIDYQNLISTYENLLQSNRQLYVSNAYLSSQHEFQVYFDTVQAYFNLEKIQDGCLGTCNIWRVEEKPLSPPMVSR